MSTHTLSSPWFWVGVVLGAVAMVLLLYAFYWLGKNQ